jgi:hypothetical protein
LEPLPNEVLGAARRSDLANARGMVRGADLANA